MGVCDGLGRGEKKVLCSFLGKHTGLYGDSGQLKGHGLFLISFSFYEKTRSIKTFTMVFKLLFENICKIFEYIFIDFS